MMNLANGLTIFRVIMIPLFMVLIFLPYHWCYFASAAVFALAGITDWLDGYVARKYNQSTPFGAFLDPVADKLMIAFALVLMTERYHTPLFAIPAAIIVGREIAISALREWMAELGKRANVGVSYIGKIKTALQMASIFTLLMVDPEWGSWMEPLGYVLLYGAAGLTLWSMLLYLKAAWPDLIGSHHKGE